ncbi:hypothetical protein K8Q98_01695 [Candidatus Nomurabacteria bacterium]|nr:hypothetical protein [Candidatus Nomurabacteria bacterium]
MSPTFKNIIIFSVIATLLILGYIYFFSGAPDEASLVSATTPTGTITPGQASLITQDFLSILLNIKSLKLDDAIFSDPVFMSLKDSSILLNPEGNEGRPNPFAPIGSDPIVVPETIPTPVTEIPGTTPTSTTPSTSFPDPATMPGI